MLLKYLNQRLFNVIHLGVSFLILFSADFTVINMQKTINTSITEEDPSYTLDGYLTLCLLYGVYGILLWMGPSIIAVIGYKASLVFGSAGLVCFMFSLTFEKVWLTYIGILLSGAGGSILWVAQGYYLVLNSDEFTMSRNVGVFWALYSASMIPGNVYAATQLVGKERIDAETRHQLLYTMSGLGGVALVLLALLRSPGGGVINNEGPVEALAKTFRLFFSTDMMLLLITFIYGGFQQSFGSGVYSPCLGFTKKFGTQAKQLVPTSGILYGIGDSVGGLAYMLLDRSKVKYQRRHIIIGGLIAQSIAFACTYVNLPNSSVFGETEEEAYIEPKVWLALTCSFLIGVGDSCLNTQIYPLLRDLHPQHSPHTSSLYKFSKSMAIAVSFFLSSYMGLHIQLAVIFCLGVAGTISFSCVDIRHRMRSINQ